ncbi:hypothetical protein KAX02_11060 [candidate division WOR-3 bacterium]|nr:hypothetical protein [candidate division WOR-3 bacterium]
METVKFECCPKCDCIHLKNNVYLKKGEPIMIYVECSKCGCFVARYIVSKYTSDKPYESLLKEMRKERLPGSRSAAKLIEEFSQPIAEKFEYIKELRDKIDEKRNVEEIIIDIEKT